jgi:hypothetical protein
MILQELSESAWKSSKIPINAKIFHIANEANTPDTKN